MIRFTLNVSPHSHLRLPNVFLWIQGRSVVRVLHTPSPGFALGAHFSFSLQSSSPMYQGGDHRSRSYRYLNITDKYGPSQRT
ncbi:hypothetical protein B0H19DRAFT_1378851 [Mycena capillaripes]|nr:hypothetical protein B0H19DRAFT_1378851 [Mycena capillaripes]